MQKLIPPSRSLTVTKPGHGQTPLADKLVLRPSHGDHSSPSVSLPPAETLPITGAGAGDGVDACGDSGSGDSGGGDSGSGDATAGGLGLGDRCGAA